jgi:hypothetical protein
LDLLIAAKSVKHSGVLRFFFAGAASVGGFSFKPNAASAFPGKANRRNKQLKPCPSPCERVVFK